MFGQIYPPIGSFLRSFFTTSEMGKASSDCLLHRGYISAVLWLVLLHLQLQTLYVPSARFYNRSQHTFICHLTAKASDSYMALAPCYL